jgi:hypothetical protein
MIVEIVPLRCSVETASRRWAKGKRDGGEG